MTDHAADATEVLTPGIGSDSHTAFSQISIQFGQENPGLDRDARPHRVESDDPVEARRVQDDPGTDGRSGERRPRGAWGERDLEVATDLQDGQDVRLARGKCDSPRFHGTRARIRRIGVSTALVRPDLARSERGFERTAKSFSGGCHSVVLRTAGRRFPFFGAAVSRLGNNVYPARRLRRLRADQPGTRTKADGTRPDGVPGARVPHPPGSRSGDGDADLALVEGPSDANLCDDATAPPERPSADPSGNTAAIRAGLVRRIPPSPRRRPSIAGETDRRGPRAPGAGIRGQRPAGARIPRSVRSHLWPEERPRALAPDVRDRLAGSDRDRDDSESGPDPRSVSAEPRGEGHPRGAIEVRIPLHAGKPRRRPHVAEARGGPPH